MLKIHYLCGRNDNSSAVAAARRGVVICSKFITFVVEMTTNEERKNESLCCDLLKIHYLCGRNDNAYRHFIPRCIVVICSKFITFVVEMTTEPLNKRFY